MGPFPFNHPKISFRMPCVSLQISSLAVAKRPQSYDLLVESVTCTCRRPKLLPPSPVWLLARAVGKGTEIYQRALPSLQLCIVCLYSLTKGLYLTSASVYAFLGVLLVVVCVASTIMTSSFVHWRRQRHLLEAIRSGTRVDDSSTSKEPRIWEVCIRKEQQVVGSNGPSWEGATGDWSSMKPFCATTSTIFDPSPYDLAPELAPDDALPPTDGSLGAFSPCRIRRTLRMTASSPLQETNPPTSWGGNIGDTNPKMISESDALEPSVPKLRKITAAILIYMPSRDRSSRRPSQLRQPAMTSPQPRVGSSPHPLPSPSIVSATPVMEQFPSASLHPQYTKSSSETKAEGLPQVEFGILELLMRDDGTRRSPE